MFRLKSFRFGVHGIAGICGFFLTLIAYLRSNFGYNLSPMLCASIILSTSVTAIGSYSLLSQVPLTSNILTSWVNIFPPHRHAFRRTIAITGYLNLRLLDEWEWFGIVPTALYKENGFVDDENVPLKSILFPMCLFLYTAYHFSPISADFSNGNTWVFIIPMFIAFSVDAFKQWPRINIEGASLGRSALKQVIFEADWVEVNKWNTNRIDETYLLLTLLCTLQVAFMFTIAFRKNMISIRSCYWIAAIEVGLLCIKVFQ